MRVKPASIVVSDTVYLTDTSTTNVLPIVGRLWTFDGDAGYGRITAHTFAVYGLFTVTVTGTNACTTPGATGSQSIDVAPMRVYLPLILRQQS